MLALTHFDQLLKKLNEFPESSSTALCALREVKGWSQEKLAFLASLTLEEIISLESGAEFMSIEQAKKLSLALGVHPGLLLFPDGTFAKSAEHEEILRRVSCEQQE